MGVVGGVMDVSDRRHLCSRCVNSTSLQLPRVMKNSGLLYLLVMSVGNEWADVVLAVVDGLIDGIRLALRFLCRMWHVFGVSTMCV